MNSGEQARIVNYAFLQELKEENTPLWEEVVQLGAYGGEPFSADWIEQNAGNLLRRLRGMLAGQFRMEECLAYIPVQGVKQSPYVSRALDEHLKILLHCVSLSEQCDELEYSGKLSCETYEIWRQLGLLYEEIMEHESLERRMIPNEKLQESLSDDEPTATKSSFWESTMLDG